MILTGMDKYRDLGLLILRIGMGGMFMYHGWPKISGGTEKWTALGLAMKNFGVTFLPTFWGFMASFAEFFGGLFFLLGLFYRPACLLLLSVMTVAATTTFSKGGLSAASHAIEAGSVFLGSFFIGPGKYSLDGEARGNYGMKP